MAVILWRQSWKTRCFCASLKLVLLIVLVVVAVVPVRNVLLHFAIPGMWTEHNSLFLLKVMLDGQYFPVDESSLDSSSAKLNVNPVDIQIKFMSEEKFSAYNQRITLLRKMSVSNSEARMELEELMNFKPRMSEYERAVALFTLDTFISACEAADLTYFLVSGSALGALRHHGMIPWDDDLDIIMNASQWRRIHSVLGRVPGFELFAPGSVQWKFFMESLPQGNKPFKWPNVDIFFFGEDDTHIWSQTWGAKKSLCSKKSDVFPLTRRKFENWNLPVPRRVDYLMSGRFGDFNSVCTTPNYNHKTNEAVLATSIDCKKLHSVFPFVFRRTSKSGAIVEVCRVAGQSIGNITVHP